MPRASTYNDSTVKSLLAAKGIVVENGIALINVDCEKEVRAIPLSTFVGITDTLCRKIATENGPKESATVINARTTAERLVKQGLMTRESADELIGKAVAMAKAEAEEAGKKEAEEEAAKKEAEEAAKNKGKK